MQRFIRLITTLFSALALTLGAAPASAHADARVAWTVDASDEYTVGNNGDQPVITYNDCIPADSAQMIGFGVSVETEGKFAARFATVGEATQNLDISFDPGSVAGNGPKTLDVMLTIGTRRQAVPRTERFGVYLEPEPGAPPLGDSFLSIDAGCIGDEESQSGDDGQTVGEGVAVPHTFKLTLHGDAREGQSFFLQYIEEGATPDMSQALVFCGALIEEESEAPCEGDGAVYTRTVSLAAGKTIRYAFGRHNPDYSEVDLFHEGTVTPETDAATARWYAFGGAAPTGGDGTGDRGSGGKPNGGQIDAGDKGEMPDELPATGAGGAAPGIQSAAWRRPDAGGSGFAVGAR